MKSHNLSGIEKAKLYQPHAVYSGITENREHTRNIGANCKTLFSPSQEG
jgi:hypothetical protein